MKIDGGSNCLDGSHRGYVSGTIGAMQGLLPQAMSGYQPLPEFTQKFTDNEVDTDST